jgi:tRNA pseudouridine38-40 synthase
VKDELDIDRMRAAARRFVGFHDFRAFSDADPDETSTEVLIDTLDIHEDEDLIVMHVEGSHFLWKMVRRLVGVLVEVGRGGLTDEDAARLLFSNEGLPARLTAPASGLFLERVFYEGDPRDVAVRPPVAVLRF